MSNQQPQKEQLVQEKPSIERKKVYHLSAEQVAYIMLGEKHLMNKIGEVCMRRCIASYEVEMLNALEQSCVDRCTSKYDQMITYIAETNPMLKTQHF